MAPKTNPVSQTGEVWFSTRANLLLQEVMGLTYTRLSDLCSNSVSKWRGLNLTPTALNTVMVFKVCRLERKWTHHKLLVQCIRLYKEMGDPSKWTIANKKKKKKIKIKHTTV